MLSPQLFSFTYGNDSAVKAGCSVLDAAFKRYFPIIFPDFTDASGKLGERLSEYGCKVLPCVKCLFTLCSK